MGLFLRLKHWQVFILGFGLFITVFILTAVYDILALLEDSFSTTDASLRLILFAQTVCLIFANFWRFAIGTRLHKKQYYNSFMLLIFRWCLYFSTLFNAARLVVFPAIDYFDGSFNTLTNLIWILGGLYCDFFAARMLVAVEQQRDVLFPDFVGELFAFIFFPVGVWWLQPRINRIFGRDDEVYDPDAPLDQHVTN